MCTIAAIVTDDVLDAAYAWLCQRRKDWSADADVWRFRQDWPQEKERLREELLAGTYEVGLLDRVTLYRDGEQEDIDLWSARDALVMKALSLVLPQYLPLSEQCTHLKGHVGVQDHLLLQIDADAWHRDRLVCEPLCLWTRGVKMALSTFETLPDSGYCGPLPSSSRRRRVRAPRVSAQRHLV